MLLNVSNLIFIFLSRGEKENKWKRKREILKRKRTGTKETKIKKIYKYAYF